MEDNVELRVPRRLQLHADITGGLLDGLTESNLFFIMA